jgi:hypothetical protein
VFPLPYFQGEACVPYSHRRLQDNDRQLLLIESVQPHICSDLFILQIETWNRSHFLRAIQQERWKSLAALFIEVKAVSYNQLAGIWPLLFLAPFKPSAI